MIIEKKTKKNRPIKNKMKWNIKNIVIIKHLQMSQILALNNPWGTDMPLDKFAFPNLDVELVL